MRDPGTPRIAVIAPQIEQGGQSTVTAEAKNIESLAFDGGPVGSNDGIQLHLGRIDYSDQPDTMEDSFPPTLHWSSPTNVTLDVPVAVTDDYPPGAYPYAVSVSNDSVLYDGGSDEVEFAITVTKSE